MRSGGGSYATPHWHFPDLYRSSVFPLAKYSMFIVNIKHIDISICSSQPPGKSDNNGKQNCLKCVDSNVSFHDKSTNGLDFVVLEIGNFFVQS